MRNDVITSLSESIEAFVTGAEDGYTEEEHVAACVAAAFGIAKTPEGYAAFNIAVKAAQMLMDRVQIPVDGHYLELEAAHQRRHGRPSPTEEKRLAMDVFLGPIERREIPSDRKLAEPVTVPLERRPNAADLEIMDQTGWKLDEKLAAVSIEEGRMTAENADKDIRSGFPDGFPGDNSIDGPAPKW